MLDCELGSSENGSIQITRLIITTVSRIKRTQFLSVCKESEKNILNRAIQKNIVLHRDPNIERLMYNLLSNKFTDKEGTMKYGNDAYKTKMSLEVKALEKETTDLNRIIAKQKRVLKSITPESIFKICVNYLTNERASSFIHFGSRNEAIWKSALFDAESRNLSLDKWSRTVSSIMSEEEYGDEFINEQMLQLCNLRMTRTEKVYIGPTTDDIEGTFDEGNLNEDDLKTIDETVRIYTEGSNSAKIGGKRNEVIYIGEVVDNDENVLSDKTTGEILNDKTTNEITDVPNIKVTNNEIAKKFSNGPNVEVNVKIMKKVRNNNETKNDNLDDDKTVPSSVHNTRKRPYNSSDKENDPRGSYYSNGKINSVVHDEHRGRTGKPGFRNNAHENLLFDDNSNKRSYNKFNQNGNGSSYNDFDRSGNGRLYNGFSRSSNRRSYGNVNRNGNGHSYNGYDQGDNNDWPSYDNFNVHVDDGYYAFNGRR